MWIDVQDEPIPTRGMDGKEFKLSLEYKNYYGHNPIKVGEVVVAKWYSGCNCFIEVKTYKEIDTREIAHWWKEED